MAVKLKIGMIGCGAIAQKGHLPYYNNYDNIQIFAADPTDDRLREIKQSFRIERCYNDYQEMLRSEKLDGVSICLPNNLHAEAAINAAKHCVNILCEKPMALKLSDAENMVDVCQQHSVFLMINFTNRFLLGPQRFKSLLEQDLIGDPYSIRVRYVHSGPYDDWAKSDWFYSPEQAGGGALTDLGVHAIDICHFLMGPIKTVTALVANLSKDIPVEDNAMLLVEFGQGLGGFIETGWTGAGGFTGVEVCGAKGSIVMDLRQGLYVSYNRSHPDGTVEFKQEKIECDIMEGGWENAIHEFVDHLTNATMPTCDGATGLSTMKVLNAAYESAQTKRKIEIKNH